MLLKAHVTHDIFTHNIAIKRYFNKNIFFNVYFFQCVNWKYLFLNNFIEKFDKILKSNYYILTKNVFLLQYLFIFLSK